jgi:hypothetical protein
MNVENVSANPLLDSVKKAVMMLMADHLVMPLGQLVREVTNHHQIDGLTLNIQQTALAVYDMVTSGQLAMVEASQDGAPETSRKLVTLPNMNFIPHNPKDPA